MSKALVLIVCIATALFGLYAFNMGLNERAGHQKCLNFCKLTAQDAEIFYGERVSKTPGYDLCLCIKNRGSDITASELPVFRMTHHTYVLLPKQ